MFEKEISQYANDFWLRTDKGFVDVMGGTYEPLIFDNNFHDTYTYVDNDGVVRTYPRIAEGNATLANENDLERDELGFTNKNLHRRVDPQEPVEAENPLNQEIEPRRYILSIHGFNSYRTTELVVHDEEQTDLEIP